MDEEKNGKEWLRRWVVDATVAASTTTTIATTAAAAAAIILLLLVLRINQLRRSVPN